MKGWEDNSVGWVDGSEVKILTSKAIGLKFGSPELPQRLGRHGRLPVTLALGRLGLDHQNKLSSEVSCMWENCEVDQKAFPQKNKIEKWFQKILETSTLGFHML